MPFNETSPTRWQFDDPSWSPSGDPVAFSANVAMSNEFDIYAIDVNGSNLTRFDRPDANEWGPAWSPSGEQIAFVSTNPNDLPPTDWRSGAGEIYLMNSSGLVEASSTLTERTPRRLLEADSRYGASPTYFYRAFDPQGSLCRCTRHPNDPWMNRRRATSPCCSTIEHSRGAFSSTTETASSRHASTTISLRKASKSSALQSARQRRRGGGALSVKTARTQCLHCLLITGGRHLDKVLRTFIAHYNHQRPHRRCI